MSPLVPVLSISDCSEISIIHYFSTGFFKSQCHAYNTVRPLNTSHCLSPHFIILE
jgi:hypothetical protein